MKVSALSFGASSLGGGVFRAVEESDALRTVAVALDLGVNFIDVAPFYGLTRAETVLGRALRGVERSRYYLSTKVGRYGDAEFDFSAKRVTASVDESLKRLGVDYVDIIQAHDIEYGDLDQIANETLPALMRIKESGKARFVGATGYPLKALESICGRFALDTVLSYNHYSLNDTTLLGLLPRLKKTDLGVINASPLSQGLLTNTGTPDWHPAQEDVKETCKQAAAYCRSKGQNIAKLALQFSVSNAEIATTLVGTADPENMKNNVSWVEEGIDEALLREVEEILKPIKDRNWVVGKVENN
jgi:aryl-alcohol dehydrogenase-like predicted oxidoreductase